MIEFFHAKGAGLSCDTLAAPIVSLIQHCHLCDGFLSIAVYLRNRTAERRRPQNACAWQTWHGYYLRVSLWSLLPINAFWSFTIGSVKKRVKFGGKFFKIKLLSRLSHKVCRLLPLPFCFVSSLIYLKSSNKLEDFGESLPFYTFFWCGISYEC